ncbi:MAG TPA: FAD-binding oxidoreductase [Anaerolineales bacterium]|nr:FAD-binding oxidoreductase [Anaerolineales bacterium]
MTLKAQTFWLDTVTMPTTDGARPLPEKVDVAVIGSGFTGLSAALALAKRGARVTVLEAEMIGWGASSRNGGMALTGMKLGLSKVLSQYGREAARRMFAASLAAIDCVEQIVTEEGIECDFSRSGHLEVACKPAHFDHFARGAALMAREFNHQVRLVPKDELRSEIGSDIYYGGFVDAMSAGVNPARYVAGLARAAQKAGAELYERARVERVERDGTTLKVRTKRGDLRAAEVVVGTSGYTGRATPSLQEKIVPIGSYIIVTEPLGEDLARAVSPRSRMIFDSKNFLYYFRLTPDRRMLFGGRAAFFPETATTVRESAEILRRGMVGVYPQLRDVKVEYVWGGTLDFAFDMMPHAGKMDGLHYALGYAGHGVAMATYLGTQLAAAISGETSDNPFAHIPFPGAPLGLYNGVPWFLPFVGAWYRFLDWIS